MKLDASVCARIHASIDDLLHTRKLPRRPRFKAAVRRAQVYAKADTDRRVAEGIYGHVARIEAMKR